MEWHLPYPQLPIEQTLPGLANFSKGNIDESKISGADCLQPARTRSLRRFNRCDECAGPARPRGGSQPGKSTTKSGSGKPTTGRAGKPARCTATAGTAT